MSRRKRLPRRQKNGLVGPVQHHLEYYEMGRLKIVRCSCKVFHKMSFNDNELRRWGNEHLAGRMAT